ncbi:titin homolog isoform X2 [Haliotis rufescens]|uniref:titin homolog isoform X2 n=1 Tax=Haliotis rufescens TaxID=6454 RepID=UPI00201E9AD1|nr:titin homolog isoform X2 [Haliotis rufescens]
METEADVSDPAVKNELISDEAEAATDEVKSPTETQVSDEKVSSEDVEIPYEGPTYSLEDMNEIRKWWEIPCVAHFCSLFRAAFDLPDFDIEELEEALLASGTPEGSMLMCDLISQLLNGCYGRNDIKSYNFEVYLRDIFKQRWQKDRQIINPLAECSFQVLTVRTKLELLQALCDFRLDADDVQDLLKGLDGDNLRVEPMGRDQNGGIYWYFYGVRLYKEDPEIKPDNTKKKKIEKKKTAKKATPVVKKKKSRPRSRRSSGRRKRVSGRKGRSRKKLEQEDVEQKEEESTLEAKADEEMEVESTEPASVTNNTEEAATTGPPQTQDGDAVDEAAPAAGDDTPSRRSSRLSRRAKGTASPAVHEDTSDDDATEEEDNEETEEEEEEEEPEEPEDSEDNEDVPLSVLKKEKVPVDRWHLVCQSLVDWEQLAENFKESKVRCEKNLYRTVTEDFLPEIPRIMEEKERDMKRRALENAPRRTSCRLEEKQKQREEEEKLLAQMLAAEEKVRHAEEEERRKMLEQEKLEIQKRQREEREKQRERMREERERAVERRAKRAALREEKTRLFAERDRLLAEGLELPPELQNLDSTNGHRDDDDDLEKIDSEKEELYSGMRKILYTVKAHDDSWPFWEPVKEEFAPDYFHVIETPMDLTMIERKLDDRDYKSVREFADDFQLLFENCEKYNGENSDFTYMARALQKIVNIRVKKLLPKTVHRYEVDDDFVPDVDISPNAKYRPRRQAASHTMENIHAMMVDQDEEVESNSSKSNYTIVYPALKARGGDMRTAEGQARFLQALQAAKRKEAAEEFLRKGNTPQRSLMVQTNTINIPKSPERPTSIEDPVKGIIIQNNRNKMQLLAKTVNITSRYNGQQQKPAAVPSEDPELAALPMHKRIQEREAQKAKNKLSEPKAEPVTDSISVVRRHDVSRVYTELIQKTAKHTSHNKYSQGKSPQTNISPKVVHISLDDFKRLQSQKAKVIVVPSGDKNKAGTVIHLSTGGIRTASSSPNAKSYIDHCKEEQKASPAQGVVPTKDVKVLEHSSDKITVLKTSPADTVAESPEKDEEMEVKLDETPDSGPETQISEPPHTAVETPKTIMKTPKKTVFYKKVDEEEDAVKEEKDDSECPVPKKKRKSVSWSQNLTTESPYVPLPLEAKSSSPARSPCLYKDGIHRRVPRMPNKIEETVVKKDEEIGSEKTVINGMIVSKSALEATPVVKTYSKREPERKRSYESDFFVEEGPAENREPSPPKLTKIEQSVSTVCDHSEDAPPDIFSDPENETLSSDTDVKVKTIAAKPSTRLYTYTREKKKKLFPKDKETVDDSTCAKVVRRTKRSPHAVRTTRRGRVSTPVRDDIVTEMPELKETRRRGRPSSSVMCYAVQMKEDIDAEKKVKFTKVYHRNKDRDPDQVDSAECDIQEPVLDLVSEANVEDFEEVVGGDVEMMDIGTEAHIETPAVDDVSGKETTAGEEPDHPEEGVEEAALDNENFENEDVENVDEEHEKEQEEKHEVKDEVKEEEKEKEKEEEMESEEDEVIQLEETASSSTQTIGEVAEVDGSVVQAEEVLVEKEETLVDDVEGEGEEDQMKEEPSQTEGLIKACQAEEVGLDTPKTEQQECEIGLEEAEVEPEQQGAEVELEVEPQQRDAEVELEVEPEQRDAEVELEVEPQQQDAEVELEVEPEQQGAEVELEVEPQQQDAEVENEVEPQQQDAEVELEVEPQQQDAEVELEVEPQQQDAEVELEVEPEQQDAEVELEVEPQQQDAEVQNEVEPQQQDAEVELEVEPQQQDAEVENEVEPQQQDAEVELEVEPQQQDAEVENEVERQQQGAEVKLEVEPQQQGAEVDLEVKSQQLGAEVELVVEPEQQDAEVENEVEPQQQGAEFKLEVEPEQQGAEVDLEVESQQRSAEVDLEVESQQHGAEVGDEVNSDPKDAEVQVNQDAYRPDMAVAESKKNNEVKVDEVHLAEEELMEQEVAEIEVRVESEHKHAEVEVYVKLDSKVEICQKTSEVQTDEVSLPKDTADEQNAAKDKPESTEGSLSDKQNSERDEPDAIEVGKMDQKEGRTSSPTSVDSQVKITSSRQLHDQSSDSYAKTTLSKSDKASDSHARTSSSSDRRSSDSYARSSSSSDRRSTDLHARSSSSSDRRSSDSHGRSSSSSDRRSSDSHGRSSSSRDRKSSDSHGRSSSSSDRKSSDSHARSSSSRDRKSSDSHGRSSSSSDRKSSDSHARSSSSRDRKSSDSHARSSSSSDRKSSHSHHKSSSSRDRSSHSHGRTSSSRERKSSHSHSKTTSSRDSKSSDSDAKSTSSRDRKSSDSHARTTSSRESKLSDSDARTTSSKSDNASDSHAKTFSSRDSKSSDSHTKTASLKEGEGVEDFCKTVETKGGVVSTEAKVEDYTGTDSSQNVEVLATSIRSSKEPEVPEGEQQVTESETEKSDEKNREGDAGTETTVEAEVETGVVEVTEVPVDKMEMDKVAVYQAELAEVEMEQGDKDEAKMEEADVAEIELSQADVEMDVDEGESENRNEVAETDMVVTGGETDDLNLTDTHQLRTPEATTGKTEVETPVAGEAVQTEVAEILQTEVPETQGLEGGTDQSSVTPITRKDKVETEATEDEANVNAVDTKTASVGEVEATTTEVEVESAREAVADIVTPDVVEDKVTKAAVPESDVVRTIEPEWETSVAENVSERVQIAAMEVEEECVENGDAVCGQAEEFQSEHLQLDGEGSEEVVEGVEVVEEVVLVVAGGDYVETRTESSADNVPAVDVSVSEEPLNSMETDDVKDVRSCDMVTDTMTTTMSQTVKQDAQDAKTSDEIIPMDTDCDEDAESKDQEISVQIIDDGVSADETGNCDIVNTGPTVSDSKSRDKSEMVEEEPNTENPPELDCCDPPVLERISPIDYKERSDSPETSPVKGCPSGALQPISYHAEQSRSVNGTESDSKTCSESDSKELPVLSEQQKDDSGDFKSPSSDPVKKSCKSPVFSPPSELPVLQKHSPTKLSHTKSSSGKSSPENSSPKRSPTSSPPKQGVDRNVFSEFASNVNSSDSKTSPTSSPSKGSPNRPNLPIGFAASLSKLKDIGTFRLSSKSKTSDGSSSDGSS